MTLDHLLLRCVSYTPDKLAVVTPHNRYTYRDLSRAAGCCANALLERGLAPGDRVVAVLDAGFDAVALFCACVQLGIIAVPVSHESSAARVQAIIDAISPAAFVSAERAETTAGQYRTATGTACGSLLEGELHWGAHHSSGRSTLQRRSALGIDPAYVNFRFGDNGRSKGVVMSHRAACFVFEALIVFNALPIGTVIGSIAPIQSDFWLLNVALALGSGGTVAFVPRHSLFDAREMARHIRALGVNQMNGVPSIWKSMLAHAEDELREVATLSSVFYAREPFPVNDLKRLQRLYPELRVINCFGHAESIACSFAEVPNPLPEKLETPSFGQSCEGVELLLLDENGARVTAPHVPGEIYLRSPALFMGYWDDPAASSRALVPHPSLPETGERVFRTGDLACFDETGNYFFAGRTDDHQKMTSNRVGPSGIATT